MRCRPGDKAIMIDALLPENVGLIVTVIERASESTWWIKPSMPIPGISEYFERQEPDMEETEHPDAWLQPIRGDREKKKKKEAEIA